MGLQITDKGEGNIPGITAGRRYIFMSADPTKHHQVILVTGRPEDSKFSNINQMSFMVDSLDQLRSMCRWAKQNGSDNIRCTDHGNSWSIYFPDPEGNNIEIYLDTPWYVPQPHAAPLDLEKSNEQILRETDVRCGKDPGCVPVADWQEKRRQALSNPAL
jgi:catechol 2,3-dioxygenase